VQLRKELAFGADIVGGGHGISVTGVGQKELAWHTAGAVLFSGHFWPCGQARTTAGFGQ
jgi:hypothetical protein